MKRLQDGSSLRFGYVTSDRHEGEERRSNRGKHYSPEGNDREEDRESKLDSERGISTVELSQRQSLSNRSFLLFAGSANSASGRSNSVVRRSVFGSILRFIQQLGSE
ncbi:hypothetical protein R1flu_021652 [Riccia fluitans]|uniref:Uncharacterized protein n=1 Tax=Riccia fluitans TaxID=41844 RepID=A0ABD1ZT66_9MARC